MVGQPRSRTRLVRASRTSERSESAQLPRIGNMIATATSCGDVESSADSRLWIWRTDASTEAEDVSSEPIVLEHEPLKSRELPPLAFPSTVSMTPRLAKEQIDELELFFQQQHKPSTSQKRRLAERLNAPLDKVNNWFQNRRAKVKQSLQYREESIDRSSPLDSHLAPPTAVVDASSIPSPLSSDWAFLSIPPDSISPECPSMTSASTISSRNSSTRSSNALRWHVGERIWDESDRDESSEEQSKTLHIRCKSLRDSLENILTNPLEHIKRCPVKTCFRHDTGFATTFDMTRHAVLHYKDPMICSFCPDSTPRVEKVFERPDLFLQHLTGSHGTDSPALSRLEPHDIDNALDNTTVGEQNNSSPILTASCTLCSEPFDLQGFIDHLTGCLYRKVAEAEETRDQLIGKPGADDGDQASPRNDSVINESQGQLIAISFETFATQGDSQSSDSNQLRKPSTTTLEQNEQDISELTASSRCLSLTSSHGFNKSSDEETDWTDEACSPSSEPDPTGALSPLKRQLVDETMKEFHRLYDQMSTNVGGGAGVQISVCASGSSSGSSQTYSSGSFSESSTGDSSQVSRKRSLSNRSLPPNGNKDNGDDPNKRRRPDSNLPTSQDAPLPEKRFACPYYKRNPGRHQTFTSCRDPGFMTVARLKEHLYRRHLLPIQCHRCCSTFPNEPTLREHQRDARVCEVQEHVPLEGFDKDQERRLKSKKRCQLQQNEEDKWKGVYRILFPDDDDDKMPSPYIEYQAQGNPNPTSNVSRFQEFSRLELPRLVRQTLEVVVEQEAQPLEEKLKDRLVNIVKECQAQLFSMFDGSIESSRNDVPQPSNSRAAQAPDSPPQTSKQLDSLPDSFRTFESLNSAALASGLPPSPPYAAVPQFTATGPKDPFAHQSSSDTPDSNAFEFTEPAPVFPAAFPREAALPPEAAFFVPNDYPGLNGYYGLFESRDNHFDPSTWPFDDASESGPSYTHPPTFQ